MLMPPLVTERFGGDWGLNARGIYYRHYYSPGWVTAGHDLWLPSLDQIDWTDSSEDSRRSRAREFVKHVLDNERWNKSEYAWEADAWTDVFGHMRNDPALAVYGVLSPSYLQHESLTCLATNTNTTPLERRGTPSHASSMASQNSSSASQTQLLALQHSGRRIIPPLWRSTTWIANAWNHSYSIGTATSDLTRDGVMPISCFPSPCTKPRAGPAMLERPAGRRAPQERRILIF